MFQAEGIVFMKALKSEGGWNAQITLAAVLRMNCKRASGGNRDIRRLLQSVREEMRLARTKVMMTNGENWID